MSAGQSFVRRDRLLQLEAEILAEWKKTPIRAELSTTKPKFFVNFPYPYMNGKLHLGHTFSLTKAEFSARFQRLQGKNVLFPFSFHCTGTPIVAAAKRLQSEFDKQALENEVEVEVEQPEAAEVEDKSASVGVFKSKKTKLTQKTGALEQSEILMQSGIPAEDIPKFCDPNHWLTFFPELAKQDLVKFGLSADWRRAFITTEDNPFYDSFVRWQFNRLKARGFVKFGKRPCIYSTLTKQPVADHDRRSGEGVDVQEYTLVKMEVLEVPADWPVDGPVFLVCATLRPETMPGQTNCFVLPEGDYGIFRMKDAYFVATERSAQNMFHQDLGPMDGTLVDLPEKLACHDLKGSQLVGLKVKAPLCPKPFVYVLPMLSIRMDKGTGIVTSVPSDSPDDFMSLKDLRTKEELRKRLGVTPEMVSDLDALPIIEIRENQETPYGQLCAPFLCEKLKIQSAKDADKLAKAKEEAYAKGFYQGYMIAGPFAGMSVQEAKLASKNLMIQENLGVTYYEPEKQVISRSLDICVAALADQWYSAFSKPEWKDQVRDFVNSDRFECFSNQNHKAYLATIDWISDWACSRRVGLGTKLPWDPEFIIESLSDSTLYFAYQTIAHLLEGGSYIYEGCTSYEGPRMGPAHILAEEMDDHAWDFVFGLGESVPDQLRPKLEPMREAFHYWYPLDLRCSGKDLVYNHLTMSLFHHQAMFPEDKMPRAFYVNGMVTVDNQKMSKSTGTFILLEEALQQWGADVTRITAADAGDSLDDCNFSRDTANNTILRLTGLLSWAEEVCAAPTESTPLDFFDEAFQASFQALVEETHGHYTVMNFREALRTSFYEFDLLKKEYLVLQSCPKISVLRKFLEAQALILFPIAPFICEYLWKKVLGKSQSLNEVEWPTYSVDRLVLRKFQALQDDIAYFKREKDRVARRKKTQPTSAKISVSADYLDWQRTVLLELQQAPKGCKGKDMATHIRPKLPGDILKKALPFAVYMSENRADYALNLPFSEFELLEAHRDVIMSQVGLASLEIVATEDPQRTAYPCQPDIFFS